MIKLKIDKHIPFPPPRAPIKAKYSQAILEMAVGDSFVVSCAVEANRAITVGNTMRPKRRLMRRTQTDGTCRVWLREIDEENQND